MKTTHVFLGGHDLEMLAILELVQSLPQVEVHDAALAWGAKASAYRDLIHNAIIQGDVVLLVELLDDLLSDIPRDRIHIVDHHGPLAGHDKPTSLEQIFQYFSFPPEAWTRDYDLISANDRAHTQGMVALGATLEEMLSIRQRDRAAQGITFEEERLGNEALNSAEKYWDGKLTIVTLPHSRTATVTDLLDHNLGGPGYKNLLILSPTQTTFFGSALYINALTSAFPQSWHGGDLPCRGYWGCAKAIVLDELLTLLGNTAI